MPTTPDLRIGVFGGGQLGQMLTLAGYPLGIETVCFDELENPPASFVGPVVAGSLDENDKLRRWATSVDILTYEWENFPLPLAADLSELRPMRPGLKALAAAQDRWHEKKLLDDLEIPVVPFRVARDHEDVINAMNDFDGPVVVKTRTGGYDGRGQVVVRNEKDLATIDEILERDAIVEQWIKYSKEVSAIGVRSIDGEIAIYPIVENEHRNGILHASLGTARISSTMSKQAGIYLETLLNGLGYVGVLTLELFVVGERLLANEMAPRVHNSGHWTIEGTETSQFENHLRAVADLPLGSTAQFCPTAMINIIGHMPDHHDILSIPGAHLHVYRKTPRPGRKIGHVTITASSEDGLHERIAAVEAVVNNRLA